MLLKKSLSFIRSERFSTPFLRLYAVSCNKKTASSYPNQSSYKAKQTSSKLEKDSQKKVDSQEPKKELLPDAHGYPIDSHKAIRLNEDFVTKEGFFKLYLRLKKEYPSEYILALQNGDFFEFFEADAVIASEVAGIALTKKGVGIQKSVNFSGFPVRFLDQYLPKFLKNGKYVILAEQLPEAERTPEDDDVSTTGKLMKLRRVTRVITPGTITEDYVLEKGSNNYLLSIYLGPKEGVSEIKHLMEQPESLNSGIVQQTLSQFRIGLAWIDISTGSYQMLQSNLLELEGYLHRLSPKEILVDTSNPLVDKYLSPLVRRMCISLTPRLSKEFQFETGIEVFREILDSGVSDNSEPLTSLIDGISPFEIQASSALLRYVKLTQQGKFPFIEFPWKKKYISDRLSNSMQIDPESFKSLEILKHSSGENKGSLLASIDHTKTPFGSRLLVQRLQAPLINLQEINNRLDFVDLFANNSHFLFDVRASLAEFSDVERSLQRLVLNRSSNGPKDLVTIKNNLFAIKKLKSSIAEYTRIMHQNKEISESQVQFLTALVTKLGDFSDIANEIDGIFVDSPSYKTDEGGLLRRDCKGPQIPSNYGHLRDLIDSADGRANELITKYKGYTGIKSLTLHHGPLVGYLVFINKGDQKYMKAFPEFDFRSKTVNGSRYETEALNHIRIEYAEAMEEIIKTEGEVYESYRRRVVSLAESLKNVINTVAEIDVSSAMGELSRKSHYTRPILVDSSDMTFEVTAGRHPVVEGLRACENKNFVNNNTNFHSNECRFMLITGPNMGGKSTYLRQNALIAIMAHCGFYVPAEYAKLSLVDAIFTRIGAADDLSRDRSTFMMEMIQTSNILSNATSRSLVIMDEIGRGTSSDEGLAIAWSVCYHLYEVVRCRTFFATHYKELAGLLSKCPLMKDYMTTAKIDDANGGKIYFHHRLERGVAKLSFGIHIAKLAGLPDQTISDANEKFAEICKLSSTGARKSSSKKLLIDPILPSTLSLSTVSSTDISRLEKLSKSLSAVNLEDMAPRQALNMLYDMKNNLH